MINCSSEMTYGDKMQKRWMDDVFEPNLVSVIVPTYNREKVIVETLSSTYTQTYRPIEVIVVDDGSTDNTRLVVNDWIKNHSEDSQYQVRYIRIENSGVCAARNLALVQSRGEFIQFLDSDDLIHGDRLERVVELFKTSGCEFIETGFEGFCSNCQEAYEKHYGHTKTDQLILLLTGRLWPNTLRATYRRSLVIRTGPWNEGMVTLQDYEYVIRVLTQHPAPKCKSIHDILASARRDSAGRMSDIIQTKEGRELRVYCEAKLCERIKKRGDVEEKYLMALASRLYALGTRCNGSGWKDLGYRCGMLAAGLNIKLDWVGKRRKIVWRMGYLGATLYNLLHSIKMFMYGNRDNVIMGHKCSKP